MKVWYLDRTTIQESYPYSEKCATCYFKFLGLECCDNPLFNNIHPCCSAGKHYRGIIKSDIFNL